MTSPFFLFQVNPDIVEAGQLRQWYDDGGAQNPANLLTQAGGGAGGATETSAAQAGSRRSVLSLIKEEQMAMDGTGAAVSTGVLATVHQIRQENLYYPACTSQLSNGRPCNKRVVERDGGWYCERCSANCTPEYRYLLGLQIMDASGVSWATAFQETGHLVLSKTADELQMLKEQNPDAFDKALRDAIWTHKRFRLRVTQDTYNDEARQKVTITGVDDINFAYESKVLLNYLEKLERNEPVFTRDPAADAARVAARRSSGGMGMGGGGAMGQASWNNRATPATAGGPGGDAQAYAFAMM